MFWNTGGARVPGIPVRLIGALSLALVAAFLPSRAQANECSGQFGDLVWYDQNGNGLQDPGEPGIAGVELSLYDANDNLLQTTTTDSNGWYFLYYFTVCGETYKIVLNESTIPDGLIPTTVMEGSDETVDSNPNPTTALLPLPPVGENFVEDLTIDFGLVDEPEICYGQIGDFVWYDLNENGIQDAGEPGIEGVEISLYDAANNLLQTVSTDANGYYLLDEGVFCGGTYYVAVNEATLPDGLVPTVTQAGGDSAIDSNPNPFEVVLPVPPAGVTFVEDLTVDFGYIEAPEECLPCDGKVTQLTLTYLGNKTNPKIKVTSKKGDIIFHGYVQPDQSFTIYGNDKHGTLGTEIIIYIDGKQNAKIHTSCSQPIGPGLVAGDFVVEEGYSRNGGLLCPLDPEGDDCKPCEGKVSELILAYNGSLDNARVVVYGKFGALIFDDYLDSGDTFYLAPPGSDTTLGVEIYIYVNGTIKGAFHTSCSQPIGPGTVSGDFTVLDGKSLRGGLLCEEDNTHTTPGGKVCTKHGKSGSSHKNCDNHKYDQKCKKHGKSGHDHSKCDNYGYDKDKGPKHNKHSHKGSFKKKGKSCR